jgi:hypothetical protein
VTETTNYPINNSYTIPTGIIGRRKQDGNLSLQKIIKYRTQWEMKKMDTQFWIPT